ncbi:MAG: sugar phosphate isomerase/epimerase [Prevotella sp.]|nr:sugar phosphate isomerase/epimerase [Prevotella sp.]
MKTSVNLYFNAQFDTAEKIRTIQQLGYPEFFTGIYDQNESLTWREQIQLAQSIGLGLTMIHCQYDTTQLNQFWLDGAAGDVVCDDYIRQIQACGALTKNFVVHLHTQNPPPPSAVGLARVRRLLAACEPFGVNLCVENLESAAFIPYIFAHIQHPLLKICYDSGHRHCFTPDFDVVKDYHQFITVLHLHQNDGTADQHQILTPDSPVFQKLVQEIPLLQSDVTLAAEIYVRDGTCTQILRANLQALQCLATAVPNHRPTPADNSL